MTMTGIIGRYPKFFHFLSSEIVEMLAFSCGSFFALESFEGKPLKMADFFVAKLLRNRAKNMLKT